VKSKKPLIIAAVTLAAVVVIAVVVGFIVQVSGPADTAEDIFNRGTPAQTQVDFTGNPNPTHLTVDFTPDDPSNYYIFTACWVTGANNPATDPSRWQEFGQAVSQVPGTNQANPIHFTPGQAGLPDGPVSTMTVAVNLNHGTPAAAAQAHATQVLNLLSQLNPCDPRH
jgi:hypothetical protein